LKHEKQNIAYHANFYFCFLWKLFFIFIIVSIWFDVFCTLLFKKKKVLLFLFDILQNNICIMLNLCIDVTVAPNYLLMIHEYKWAFKIFIFLIYHMVGLVNLSRATSGLARFKWEPSKRCVVGKGKGFRFNHKIIFKI
jgi:hypothetical protein